MVKCNDDCIPCCDFCIHSEHEYFESNGKIVKGGPIGCLLHTDEEHQQIAEGCGSCEDFHCFNARRNESLMR